MPVFSKSLNARPCSLPLVGKSSKYLQLANLVVFRVNSALRPPMTKANKAFVCWYKNVLFAEPPPLAMNKKSYVYLRWKVCGRVFFCVHVQRSHLGIAKVSFCVGVVDSARNMLLIIAICPNKLSFFTHANGGASVLTAR
ncbi:hypothetical protein BpHYR1_012934 [Brachionus plicatilis]|uniref:Uncharacterized protein n=1 Tax=Brachionus plicatilis TaxID=10195 RepID=A0A3M7SPK4_BRAPC|nr:hypothetical protein BpHYR1_012934 [Brachionus plicatilis]